MHSRYFVPYNASLTEYARENRKKPTQTEKQFRNLVLRKKGLLGYKFRRQKVVESFILDFYCSKLLLGIEVDGGYHKKIASQDRVRDSDIHKHGIEVIRFTNQDVEENLEGVIQGLISYIKKREVVVSKMIARKKLDEEESLST